jgi:hypothetical protein
MNFVVPPGGFRGFAQMTPASQRALGGAARATRTTRKRRTRTKGSKAARRSGQRAKRSSGRKMKFGSPAWQKKYKVGKFRK